MCCKRDLTALGCLYELHQSSPFVIFGQLLSFILNIIYVFCNMYHDSFSFWLSLLASANIKSVTYFQLCPIVPYCNQQIYFLLLVDML